MYGQSGVRFSTKVACLLACGLTPAALLGISDSEARAASDELKICIEGSSRRLDDGTCKGRVERYVRAKSNQPAKPAIESNGQALPNTPAVQSGVQKALPPAPTLPKAEASKGCVDGWNTHLVIGDSFNDLNFLNTATCQAGAAKGAQFSWTRDRVAANDQWSAKGAVAEKFIWVGGPDGPPNSAYLNLLAFAPFVTFQRVTNSNPKSASQNADVLSYGFSSEALFDRVADVWQVYLRARANVNSAFDGPIKSRSLTGEVQPLSDAYFIGRNIPIRGIGYFWVIPLIRAQYFQRVSNSTPADPIFNQSNDVFRAGPVISLNLIPQDSVNVDPNKPAPAPLWILNVTYSWYRDFRNNQTYHHFNPSFTYNFTESIGASIGYESGQVDQTGKKIDLTTISLTIKN